MGTVIPYMFDTWYIGLELSSLQSWVVSPQKAGRPVSLPR